MDVTRSIRGALAGLVRAIVEPRIDYLAVYPCKVLAQAADGTLELRPETSRLPEMVGIPIRYGVPGVQAKVKPGARVMVEFASGDPRHPMATIWESAAVSELTITADKVLLGGSRPLVRQGDPVMVMLGPAAAAKVLSGGVGTGVPLSGYVLLGSSKLKGG